MANANGSKPTAKSTNPPSPSSTTTENLLLSQAVAQLGTKDWTAVAALLAPLPFVKDAASVFTADFCSKRFKQIITEEGLDLSKAAGPNSRPARKLARKFYGKRIEELAAAVRARFEEEATLLAEIKEIQAGKWDQKILESVPEDIRKTLEASTLTSSKGKKVQNDDDEDAEMESVAEVEEDEDDVRTSRATTPMEASKRKGAAPKTGGRKTRGSSRAVKEDSPDEEDGTIPTKEGASDAPTPSEMEVESEEDEEKGGNKKGKKKAATSKSSAARRNKRRQSEAPVDASPPVSNRSSKRAKTEEISEETPAPASDKDEKKANAAFRKKITALLAQLENLSEAHTFVTPVTASMAPNYPAAVFRPMCLKDVARRVKEQKSTTTVEVMRDVALIFANAVQFNGENDIIGKGAQKVWEKFEEIMHLSESREHTS